MSQTVKFGRKAPTSLVNFFKSTIGQAICALVLLLMVGIIAAPTSLSSDSRRLRPSYWRGSSCSKTSKKLRAESLFFHCEVYSRAMDAVVSF